MSASEDALAHGLPDVTEIEEILTAAASGAGATKTQLDRVDESLESVRGELLELVERELPAVLTRHDSYRPEHLRALLERVADLREALRVRRETAPE